MINQFLQKAPANGVTRFIFVRHGQTHANANHYLQGQSDGLLNEVGLEQARELGKHLKAVFIEKIYCSDKKRAQATAQAVADEKEMPITTEARLQEWNCGDWDLMAFADFLKLIEEQGLDISAFEPPNGENASQLRQRATEVLSDIFAQSEGKSVLIVSHGDLIRNMIGSLMQIEARIARNIQIDNASYSVLEKHRGSWQIVKLNITTY